MKFEIEKDQRFHSYDDRWNLKFNDEVILQSNEKKRIIEVIEKVLEALL